MEEHAKVKKRQGSSQADETLLRLHILPQLGSMKVNAIDRRDIGQLHHAMRNRPGAANRTLALLSKMFNLAEKWGLRPDGSNPCRHVEKYRERKIERFLSNKELAQLGQVLAEAEHTQTEMPSVIAALRLLLFTGCRLSEILTVRWDEVDLENQCLRLRESKTGAKVVYLPPPAIEVLSAIERQDNNPFVIVGAKRGSHLVNLQKPWRRIRAKAGLEDVRIHDLRHSFASVAAVSGLSLPIIGALLGHTQPQTTQRYAHLVGDPLREAVDLIGSRIADAVTGRKQPERPGRAHNNQRSGNAPKARPPE
jgi:integrase